MQLLTVCVLACVLSAACASVYPAYPALDALEDGLEDGLLREDTLAGHERTSRDKRSLLLLKKKLLLGAIGLKAAKIGAVGGVVAGAALAHKSHPKKIIRIITPHSYGYSSHGPTWNVQVHRWH